VSLRGGSSDGVSIMLSMSATNLGRADFGGGADRAGACADLERVRLEDYAAECGEIDELATLASHLAAATARFVEMVWRQHERHGAEAAGFVAYRCGITGQEAVEYVRVAEALQGLPVLRAAFGRGEITYAKVRALTRVATASSEEALLELAGALTATRLQRALRAYRRVAAAEARRSHELEHVSWWFAEDGSLILSARLAAEDGTLVVRALEAARERVVERRRQERAEARAPPATAPWRRSTRRGPCRSRRWPRSHTPRWPRRTRPVCRVRG